MERVGGPLPKLQAPTWPHSYTHTQTQMGDASENRGRLVSRNAINGGREGGEKSSEGWQEEKEKEVGGDRDVRAGESVFVTRVHG